MMRENFSLIRFSQLVFYVFIVLTIIVAIASGLGFLGKWNMYFEALTNFKLQLFCLSLIICCFFLLHKKTTWSVIAVFCLLSNAIFIIPWYFPFYLVESEQNSNFKVLVFNVLHNNKRYQSATDLVAQESPDIVVFLEVSKAWRRQLTTLKESYDYHFSFPRLDTEIYSNRTLNNIQTDIYGRHRGIITSEVEVAQQNVIFIATHTPPQLYYGFHGFQLRNSQLLQGIGKQVSKIKQPVVLVGDLNVTMWSPFYQEMMEISGLKNARRGFGVLPTQSSFSPSVGLLSVPLDHCLVSQSIEVKKIKTGADIGSDHLPVIVDLLIPN